MKELKNDIKNRNFKNVYLFWGEERYLKNRYEEKIKNALIPEDDIMNISEFYGRDFKIRDITDAADTMPFMNDYRLILIKDSGLMAAGRKNDSEEMAEYIDSIPESSIIVFIEDKIDKRGRLYKAVSKRGRAVEFGIPREKELVQWVMGIVEKKDMKIENDTAEFFLRFVGGSMENINGELEKLIMYKQEGRIEKNDIEQICTKALETKIFDMVSAIGNKNAGEAIEIYNNLLLYKESPIMILAMVERQFRLILQSKYLAGEGKNNEEIAEALKIRGFTVREYLKQGKNFRYDVILEALKDCLECDRKIKTGLLEQRLGVEMIILRYSMK